jgi:predicted TIM-barrel fold metal-dependent hydrolase
VRVGRIPPSSTRTILGPIRICSRSWLRVERHVTVAPTIDVHQHILPDFFWRETNEGASPVGGITPPPWTESTALAFMDDAGIDVAMLSISTPGVHVGDDKRARALTRRCNEFVATLVQSRLDRFGSFAAPPLPDVDGALEELSYALDVLKLDGVLLFSNVQGVYLGDPRLEPEFTELDRRAATVFVHPNPSPDPVAHRLGLPDSLIDFTADTTRAVAEMLYSNRFARTSAEPSPRPCGRCNLHETGAIHTIVQ